MITTLTENELRDYTSRQLNNFYPDNQTVNLNLYADAVDLALQRLDHCFKYCTLKHYNDGTQTRFNHLFSDHYVMYLWYLANSMWQLHQDKSICNKLYYLNKSLHGLDCMYDTKMPDIFLIFHGVGTMLGKAAYKDFFVVLQGCTVGSHKGKYPIMGKGVSLTANSSILGDCKIGNRVNIGSGTILFQKEIPNDTSVAADAETGTLKFRESKSSYAQQFFNVDLSQIKRKNMPILSIIIPTKNRQMTALFAVKTALTVPSDDIEIIVQDCSDDDSLKHDLQNLNDTRIKYFFQNDPISMTENWNRAYAHATGDYQIGIGDDDAVFPEILEVANWAKSNGLEAVGQTEPYHYFWPNFPVHHIKNRLLLKSFAGNTTSVTDLKATVLKRSKICDDGYGIDLPMVYHRLISKNLLQKLLSVTGKLLDATSLDVYSSFAIGLLCKDFTIVDYPFSMRGASGQSNSGRFVVKKDKQHFDEYKYINYPDWLPKIALVHVSIAESIYRAFVNTGNEALVSNIDKKFLYASCLLERPEEKNYILEFVHKHLSEKERTEMFQLMAEIKKKKSRFNFLVSLETVDRYIPILKIYRKLIGKKIIKLSDTMAVLEFHKNYVKENNIKLNLPKM